MQNDFIDGALGSEAAQAVVPNAVSKIESFEGHVIATRDTHGQDYLTDTLEGRLLPVAHCIRGSHGWMLSDKISGAIERKGDFEYIDKTTFGSVDLPSHIAAIPGFGKQSEIELIGLDTDICVVSNALALRMHFPDNPIKVDASCCAGTTPERHRAALETLKSCQIEITGE